MSQAIQNLRNQLHISHSQLFTYLNCSLKYWFAYVQKLPGAHSSVVLHFGKAIHTCLEAFYLALKETGAKLPLSELESIFERSFYHSMEHVDVPILFKKDIPDLPSGIGMGKNMLQVFHEEVNLDGHTIEAVELPLSAQLYDQNSQPLDIQLIGIIDLLLHDGKGNLVVVDHKTSKLAKSQSAVDFDLQTTAYSYLLASNRYVFPLAEVQARFDVLRKLKTPKFEHYYTRRGPDSRKRFARLSATVLSGIENRVFLPCRGWLCADCEHGVACRNW